MRKRQRNRWSAEQLQHCRALFESGMKPAAIGAQFGISGTTVSVMAWRLEWQRRSKPAGGDRPVAATASATVVAAGENVTPAPGEIVVTAQERAFNEGLRRTIAEYWRAQGREVDLHVEEQGFDLLGIRSKSVNGVPVKR